MYVYVWKDRAIVIATDMAHARQQLVHALLSKHAMEARK